MTFLLQLVITGFAQGMIYALIAIGFVIILKCSEVFNIAQGHFVLIGGYLGYTLLVPMGLPIWAALGLAIATAAVMGLLIERLILRPLLGEPVLAVIMITIALASVLGGLATLFWGGEYKSYHGLLPSISLKIGAVSVPSESMIGFIVSVICVALLMLLFRYTKIGLAMRATADDLQVFEPNTILYGQFIRPANTALPEDISEDLTSTMVDFFTDRTEGAERLNTLLDATALVPVDQTSYANFLALVENSGWNMAYIE